MAAESELVNDDFCSLCSDGGILVCCEKCVRSYHFACARLDEDDCDDSIFTCQVRSYAESVRVCAHQRKLACVSCVRFRLMK